MLARHLAFCGFKAEQAFNRASMDHAELRTKVRDYFRAQLEDGKRRIDASGPLSAEQREVYATSLAMMENGNREYWLLLGSDIARAELDAFFAATGLSRAEYQDHIPRVLDEIRKARIGAHKAMLQHAEGLDAYDFAEPLRAAESAPVAPGGKAAYPTISEAVEAFFRVHEKSAVWTPGTVEKRRAMLAIAVEWFGPVALLCRPKCSFKPPSVRMRPGFSSPVLSAVDADCRTRLCIRRSPSRLAVVFSTCAARSTRP